MLSRKTKLAHFIYAVSGFVNKVNLLDTENLLRFAAKSSTFIN